jgi:hypothetical protein
MTVPYMNKAGTANKLGSFSKLMFRSGSSMVVGCQFIANTFYFRWRGSLWHNIYQHLCFQLTLYFTATLIYWFILMKIPALSSVKLLVKVISCMTYNANCTPFSYYERLCLACEKESKDFPVKLMIGFFVNQVARRWWWHFQSIAVPDHFCYKLIAFGPEEKAKLHRRTVARYMNLTIIETLRSVSLRAAKRFPSYNDLVKCGKCDEETSLYSNLTHESFVICELLF